MENIILKKNGIKGYFFWKITKRKKIRKIEYKSKTEKVEAF